MNHWVSEASERRLCSALDCFSKANALQKVRWYEQRPLQEGTCTSRGTDLIRVIEHAVPTLDELVADRGQPRVRVIPEDAADALRGALGDGAQVEVRGVERVRRASDDQGDRREGRVARVGIRAGTEGAGRILCPRDGGVQLLGRGGGNVDQGGPRVDDGAEGAGRGAVVVGEAGALQIDQGRSSGGVSGDRIAMGDRRRTGVFQ